MKSVGLPIAGHDWTQCPVHVVKANDINCGIGGIGDPKRIIHRVAEMSIIRRTRCQRHSRRAVMTTAPLGLRHSRTGMANRAAKGASARD